MEEHIVKILSITPVTHDVKQYKVEKPEGYQFTPGQATEVAINRPRWKEERRPFTFTSLNEWDHLEFTIKSYRDHPGVTHELDLLKPGDELLLHDVWGAIQYKGEGTFLAGGAGITPFIAIFRQLNQDGKIGNNRLYFSNKTTDDIILKDEFQKMLGKNFINIISHQKAEGYEHGRIDEEFLRTHLQNFHQHFYICGPDPMVQVLQKALTNLGAGHDLVVVEV